MVERLPILFYNKCATTLSRALFFVSFLKSHSKGMIEIPKHILTTIMCISCVEVSGGFYFALSNRHFKTLFRSM